MVEQNVESTNESTNAEYKGKVIVVGDSMIRHIQLKGVQPQKFTLSGARIEDITDRLEHIIGGTRVDALVLCAGTNNIKQDSPEQIRVKFCDMLRAAAEHHNGKVIINSIPPRRGVSDEKI